MSARYVINDNPTGTVAPATLELLTGNTGSIEVVDIRDDVSVIFEKRQLERPASGERTLASARSPGIILKVLGVERTLASLRDDELGLVSSAYGIPRDELVELRTLEIAYRKSVAAQV